MTFHHYHFWALLICWACGLKAGAWEGLFEVEVPDELLNEVPHGL